MALTLNNFVGFETGGLEEIAGTFGAPTASETQKHAGVYSGRIPSGSRIDWPIITGSAGAGNDYIVGFWVYFDDINGVIGTFVRAYDDSGSIDGSCFLLRLSAANLILEDSADVQVVSVDNPFSAGRWQLVEIRWQYSDAGAFDLHVDGVSKISEVGVDLKFNPAGTITEDGGNYLMFGRSSGGANYHYIDDIYSYSGAAGVGDFLGDSEVFKYQSVKASDTPDNGSVLDAGTWDKAGETPLAATATNPEYESTGAGSVNSDDVNGFPEGPKNDARIDGDANIRGMKGLSNMKRSGGGGTAHYILMGNDVDGTTRSPDIDPSTAFATYFFISEAAGIVPLSTEYCSIGFEQTNAQDYECQEQWAMLLHVPSLGPPVGADEMMAAIGQQTGGGGGSGDIMAHERKPPEAVAY